MLSTYIDLTKPGLNSVAHLTMMELTVLEVEKSQKIDVFHVFWACLQLQCSSIQWIVSGIRNWDRDRLRTFVFHQEKSMRKALNLFWRCTELFPVWVDFVFWSFPPCTKTLPPPAPNPFPPCTSNLEARILASGGCPKIWNYFCEPKTLVFSCTNRPRTIWAPQTAFDHHVFLQISAWIWMLKSQISELQIWDLKNCHRRNLEFLKFRF